MPPSLRIHYPLAWYFLCSLYGIINRELFFIGLCIFGSTLLYGLRCRMFKVICRALNILPCVTAK